MSLRDGCGAIGEQLTSVLLPSFGVGRRCACLLARGAVTEDNGELIVRPYTPITTNALVGRFELLVKIYPHGRFSSWLDTVPVGTTIDFKHIQQNVKVCPPRSRRSLLLRYH